MEWWLYPKQEEADAPMPMRMIVAFYIIAIFGGLAIEIVNWPENKQVSLFFFVPSVLLPFSIVTAGVFILRMYNSALINYAEIRKYIAKQQEISLKHYACQNIALAAWSSITPVEKLALNMLNLEGEFPQAPKTPLKIEMREAFEKTANEQLLTQLLASMAEKLKMNPYHNAEFFVWVRAGDEHCIEELRRSLDNFNLFSARTCKINFIKECPDYELVGHWIKQSNRCKINIILITIDMHIDSDVDCNWMENASAFLFTNNYVRIEGEKPIYVYMPMSRVDVEDKMPVYLDVVPVSAPKVLWFTGLSGREKYPLLAALDAKGLAKVRLDLEASVGRGSDGYRWLSMALAAEAVNYAQGNQLLADSSKNHFSITALSSRLPNKPRPCEWGNWPLPAIESIIAGCFIGFVLFLIHVIINKSPPTIWGVIAWGVFSIIIPSLLGFLITDYSTSEACKDMRR